MRLKNLAISLLAALAMCSPAIAQNRVGFGGLYNAFDFAYGVQPNVPALTVTLGQNTSGTYSIALSSGTINLPDGTIAAPLAVGVPITVGIGAVQETVTPTGVSQACSTPNAPQNACLVTAVFTQPHNTGDLVASSSNGLDEAALYASLHGGGLVALSPAWFGRYSSRSVALTYLGTQNAPSLSVSALDHSGVPGALSYKPASTAGTAWTTTTHVIY